MADAPRRLRVAPAALVAGPLRLEGAAAHYVSHVLRLGPGAALELFDGRGRGATASVVEGPEVTLRVGPPASRPDGPERVLAVAMPRGERAAWLVEKVTELGVTAIAWLTCERSVVRGRGEEKAARLERVAAAAARQSGRYRVPDLRGPTPLGAFLALDDGLAAGAVRAVATPGAPALGAAGGRHTVVLIGPEGGLTGAELRAAAAAGYIAAGLSPFTLRVETAAVAAAARLWGSDAPPSGR